MNDYVIAGGLSGPWKKIKSKKLNIEHDIDTINVEVNVTSETATATSDKTFAEIVELINAGKTVKGKVKFITAGGTIYMYAFVSAYTFEVDVETEEETITAFIMGCIVNSGSNLSSVPSLYQITFNSEGVYPIKQDLSVNE